MKRMLKAILEIEPDALSQKPIWMPDLRVKLMNLSDEVFKDMLMQLVKAELVFLQKHAHPAQASDVERRLMVEHDGNLYCALAVRDSASEQVRKILSAPERKKKKAVLSCETSVKDISQKKRGGRGGAREGSGRQCIKVKDKRVSLGAARIPQWIFDWMKANKDDSLGKMVEKALIHYYGLKMPD